MLSAKSLKLSLIIICALVLSSRQSFAQQYANNYQYVIGERAAGMGGAYTALANDSTALWYNPAGLARIKDFHLNVTANTYSYLKTKTDGYMQLPAADGGTTSINDASSDFSVVSNALIFGNKLNGNQSIAFGIIIPYQDTLIGGISGKDLTNLVGYNTLSIKEDYNVSSKYYLAMVGYGAQLNNALNVGASIGLGYYKANSTDNLLLYATDTTNAVFLSTYDLTDEITEYTIQIGLGAQIDINKNQKLGLYVQAPTYGLSGQNKYREMIYSLSTSTAYQTEASWNESTTKISQSSPILPGFISLGYGYEKADSFAFSFDIIPVFPTNKTQNMVVNFKTGVEAYLSPTSIIRAGLFTDFSQAKSAWVSDTWEKIDYYGCTLSYSYGKKFSGEEVRKEGIKTIHNSVNRTLWSTFGVVGRYGVGDTQVNIYDADYNSTSQLKSKSVLNVQAFIAESVAF